MFDSAALGIRCRDSSDDDSSDDSSADSDSEIDEHLAKPSIRLITTMSDEDESVESALAAIRIPESFSGDLTLVMNRQRKVSTASRRSAQNIAVSVYDTERETKSKERTRPAPINFGVLQNTAPRIEVEQVFDDVAVVEELGAEPIQDAQKRQSLDLENVNVSAASKRSAARTRMMLAIGRNRKAQLRRSESMDEVTSASPSSPSSSTSTLIPSPSASSSTTSPLPCTPGTAFHHRSVSCPSPLVPQLHQFGDVSVMVTPPTPRPQGSPIIGVFIRGVHKAPPATRYCPCSFALDPLLPQEYAKVTSSNGGACAQCKEEASLKVPEFEMAPGRTRIMQQQRQQALALIAWQRSQQQAANEEWCRQNQQEAYQQLSIKHVSRRSPPSNVSSASDSPCWRREQASASVGWTGSSASMYSQESNGSAADSAKSWRRQAPRSAPPASASCSTGKYIPPAKRSAGVQSTVKGRKEGCAAQATVASTKSNASSVCNSPERERAAQCMLARLHLVHPTSNTRLTR
jgi:hypothetical protein